MATVGGYRVRYRCVSVDEGMSVFGEREMEKGEKWCLFHPRMDSCTRPDEATGRYRHAFYS